MVTVYTKDYCRYCAAAKSLLNDRGIPFQEIELDPSDEKTWTDLVKRSGMRTVPQIFHDDKLIGGFDQLSALDRAQGLAHLK